MTIKNKILSKMLPIYMILVKYENKVSIGFFILNIIILLQIIISNII